MDIKKDPMGRAIADYHRTGKAGRLRVFSPMFEEDEIPVQTLFRNYQEMPETEQKRLAWPMGRRLMWELALVAIHWFSSSEAWM